MTNPIVLAAAVVLLTAAAVLVGEVRRRPDEQSGYGYLMIVVACGALVLYVVWG